MKLRWQILIMLGCLVIVQLVFVFVAILIKWPIIHVIGEPISIAVFDFWSMGHLILGIAIFIFAFSIYFIWKNRDVDPENVSIHTVKIPTPRKMFNSWIISVITAIVWEIVENTLGLYLRMKLIFDSPLNIISDIILWSIGGLVAWYITHLMFVSKRYILVFYAYGVLTLLVGVFYSVLYI
ncbi:hypothetical protein LCGC14_2403640 [marine sediment metagenome]|uniref:Uncharacterized protein n=1 Tax=marine sediment metagenome TaxID=412755 RepID=A0A0F9E6U5_9ZZZZ